MESLATHRPPRLLAGLDVGQIHDPCALAIMEREMVLQQGRLEPRFLVRHLERLPLGTPYPQMVRGVHARLTGLNAHCALLIDATGVGRGIVDLFREALRPSVERSPAGVLVPSLPGRVAVPIVPVAITMTGGERITSERWDEWHVPKRELVMDLQVALQQGRLRVARALPEAATLVKEMQQFTLKVSKAGNDQYGAWREGAHDDLLLAVAIAVWWGTRFAPGQADAGRQTHASATGNPLVRRARRQAHDHPVLRSLGVPSHG